MLTSVILTMIYSKIKFIAAQHPTHLLFICDAFQKIKKTPTLILTMLTLEFYERLAKLYLGNSNVMVERHNV